MATIRDVARAVGVSIATVSRVYTGSSRVSEETSRKVMAAAAELDYYPHAAARILTTKRTHTLGVLLPDLFGEFFSEVIRGIDQTARREDYQILVSSSHASGEELLSAARTMRGRVDGLLLMAPDETIAPVLRQVTKGFQVILLNPPINGGGCGSLSVGNFEGARSAVRHLTSLGHRRIAIVTGPAHNLDSEERHRGYREAMAEAGLIPDPALQTQGDFTEESGHRCALELLRGGPRPTAIFSANDCMAIGVMSAVAAAGLRIPEDLAVVGFDDIAAARYLNPSLTTISVRPYELGRRAVTRWLEEDFSEQGDSPVHEVLPASLVIRGSCGGSSAPLSQGPAPAPDDTTVPRHPEEVTND